MTDKLENILRMYFTVSAVCDASTEIWESNEVFTSSYKKFCGKIPEIQRLIDLSKIEVIAAETFKSFDRYELEELAFYISGKMQKYARNTKNEKLFNRIHEILHNLSNKTDSEIIAICGEIAQLASENMSTLESYEINTESLAEFQQFISYYTAHSNFYKHNAIKSKSITENLKKYIKEANDILKEHLDQEISFFRNSDPDFFNQYNAAREVLQLEVGPIRTFSGKLMDFVN